MDAKKGFQEEAAFKWVLKNDKILIAEREEAIPDLGAYQQE